MGFLGWGQEHPEAKGIIPYTSETPAGFRPYDPGTFGLTIDIGPRTSMRTLTEVVTELDAMTDLGLSWGIVLAQSAAAWDMSVMTYPSPPGTRSAPSRSDPPPDVNPVGRRGFLPTPEMVYYRDSRALELLGRVRPTVERLTYVNPLELVIYGSGLALTAVIMAARFVRDWPSERRIGEAEARKATAEARVAETWAQREEAITAFAQCWLADEAARTSTPLPIGEMTAITAGNNFSSLRRLKNRSIELTLPKPHGSPAPMPWEEGAPEQKPPDQKT